MLEWVLLIVFGLLIGAYALIMTGHYANRTPRQRTALIVLFALICFAILIKWAYGIEFNK